jgi:ATP-binding cassette subfamily C (CFTR/MRP) protein 1
MRLRRSKSNLEVVCTALTNVIHSLDAESDSVVQRLLRQKFAAHTIIAVAHKLDTVLDFDKVVVMKQGALIEYGEPYKLLEQQGSYFKSLYEDVMRLGNGE